MEIVLPNTVTYRELMLVYKLSKEQAHHKLWVIRGILSKQPHQNVLIAEFCQAENVPKEIFITELKEAYQRTHQKPQQQLAFTFK